MRKSLAPAALLLLLLLLPALLGAQETTGNLFVAVTDPQSHPLPGVSLSLVAGSDSQSGVTDAAGHATFKNLPPGDYTVKAELGGFATQKISTTVDVGRTTDLNIVLQPATRDGN